MQTDNQVRWRVVSWLGLASEIEAVRGVGLTDLA